MDNMGYLEHILQHMSKAPPRARKTPAQRTEFTCVRCGFTKVWTQKQWNTHMLKVHDFNNEQSVLPL